MSKFKNPLNFFKKKEKKKEDEKVEEKKQKQEYDYSGTKIANGSSSEDENFKNLRDKIEEDKNKTEKTEHTETEAPKNSGEKTEEKVSETSKENVEQTVKTEHTETKAPKNSGEKTEEKVSETSKENVEQTVKTEHTETEAPKNSGEKIEEKVSETSKENAEQTDKTEHTETETKPEAKNNENSEKMFEEIKALNEKMENLNNLFVKKIGSIEFEREVGNKLHKELQEYKNDFYFQLIKPTILDLIRVRDNFKAGVKEFSKKSREEQDRFLRSFIDGIDIILDDNEIEIFETDLTDENNQKYNSRKQKIVRKVETQEKEKNGKICELISEGYIRNEKVIECEKVKVYVYKEKRDEKSKGE